MSILVCSIMFVSSFFSVIIKFLDTHEKIHWIIEFAKEFSLKLSSPVGGIFVTVALFVVVAVR